jgi:pimeloyl-ACP methyl ester carboxylesterase
MENILRTFLNLYNAIVLNYFEMSGMRVGDITFNLEESGEGRPLILLHGLLGSIESDWRRFIPFFSREYHVIAVDMRGHGLTDNPEGKLSDVLFRDDLIGLLDALHLESVLVCGYSLGGFVGLIAGIQHPRRIKALVMHASKMYWDENAVRSMIDRMDPDRIVTEDPKFAEALQKLHGKRWRNLLKEAASFMQNKGLKTLNREYLERANFPVLVSVGDHDDFIPPEEAVRFYRSLPKGELLIMPNTRHSIRSVREDIFIPVVLDFFKRATQ